MSPTLFEQWCGLSVSRDLKIRGRDKLRRLPEVNLRNEACAHEAKTRVLAQVAQAHYASREQHYPT